MSQEISWREEAWDALLIKLWDSRGDAVNSVVYTKEDLDPILSRYTRSGQGEIRIFNSGSNKLNALKKRNVMKIPLTRERWVIIDKPPSIELNEPEISIDFLPQQSLTEGMRKGISDSMQQSSNPGETTLLAIANHIGVIADFYDLKERGVLFTGGRQRAAVQIVVGDVELDISKAQIEIDGGFEWAQAVVIAEMKSSFRQNDFDINQALIPMLKWQKFLPNKKVYSLVMLAQTNPEGIEYWAYDIARTSGLNAKVARSKKYKINLTDV